MNLNEINIIADFAKEADVVVRGIESDFAPIYDDVQFTSPGMAYMARRDLQLMGEALGDINGKRILDIGAGTGRATEALVRGVGPEGKVYAVDTARPYLERLAFKTSGGDFSPSVLKLGLADFQSTDMTELWKFLDKEQLDKIVILFGPLALMTTDPQGVMDRCAELLKPDGTLFLTTNSLNALPYRVPEAEIKKGADPKLPLGYKQSNYTERAFPDPEMNGRPNGMVIGDGMVLPAIYFTADEVMEMGKKALLRPISARGICRLTGLYPAEPNDQTLRRYIEITDQYVSRGIAERMARVILNPDEVMKIAISEDEKWSNLLLDEYNYPAIRLDKVQ